MIKFFRKIRQNLLTENKFSKYLLYAVGEIILVVIGILIALQINNWNQERKNQKLKVFYMNSIVNDLVKDTLDINRITHIQITDNEATKKYLNRILNSSSTIDTIINIARNEFNYYFQVKRDYANNTFNTLISTGNIELLDKELIEKLMELNSLQIDQLKRADSHINYYQTIMSNNIRSFPLLINIPEDNIVERTLWKDINEKELVGNLTAVIGVRKLMFENTIIGHLKVKEKEKDIFKLIEKLLNK